MSEVMQDSRRDTTAGSRIHDAGPAFRGTGIMHAVQRQHLGVSENSVPLNSMVNDHYPY